MPLSPPAPPSPTRVRPRLLLGIWAALIAVPLLLHEVLLPFLTALLVAYVIAPLVERLARLRLGGRHLPRWAAILSLYAAFFLALYLAGLAALPQLSRELGRLTVEARAFVASLSPERVDALVGDAERWLGAHGLPIELGDASEAAASDDGPRLRIDVEAGLRSGIESVRSWLASNFLALVGYSQRFVAGVLEGVFLLFFVLMVAGFLLVDLAPIRRFFAGLLPPDWRPDFDELLVRLDARLAGVVRGQVVICVVNGVLTGVGLLLLQVKFALVLAAMATVLSLIPIFGSILSTIPIVLVGLTQSWETGLLALAWIVAIHALEAYFLNPKIMGRAAQLHPAVVALSLIAAERSFGFVGALFAVPIASVAIGLLEHTRDRATTPLDDAAPPDVARRDVASD